METLPEGSLPPAAAIATSTRRSMSASRRRELDSTAFDVESKPRASISSTSSSSSTADSLIEPPSPSTLEPGLGLGISCPLPPPRPGRRRAKVSTGNGSPIIARDDLDSPAAQSVDGTSYFHQDPRARLASWSHPVAHAIVGSGASIQLNDFPPLLRRQGASGVALRQDLQASTDAVIVDKEKALPYPNGLLQSCRSLTDNDEDECSSIEKDDVAQVQRIHDPSYDDQYSHVTKAWELAYLPELAMSSTQEHPEATQTDSSIEPRYEWDAPERRTSLRRMFSEATLDTAPPVTSRLVPRHLSETSYIYYRGPAAPQQRVALSVMEGSVDCANDVGPEYPKLASSTSAVAEEGNTPSPSPKTDNTVISSSSPAVENAAVPKSAFGLSGTSHAVSSMHPPSASYPTYPATASLPAPSVPSSTTAKEAVQGTVKQRVPQNQSSVGTKTKSKASKAHRSALKQSSRPSTSTFGAGGTVFAFGTSVAGDVVTPP